MMTRRKFSTRLGALASVFPIGQALAATRRCDLRVVALLWRNGPSGTWHNGSVPQDASVMFRATIRNSGDAASPAAGFRTSFRVDGSEVAFVDRTGGLAVGAQVNVQAGTWFPDRSGLLPVAAVADSLGKVIEKSETNNTLQKTIEVKGAAPPPQISSPTIGAMSGAGNLFVGDETSAAYKLRDLTALHCGMARISASPQNHYFKDELPSPERFDGLVVAMLQRNIKPYFSFVFTDLMNSGTIGIPARNYADWFSIGQAFAGRFRRGSSFLVGRGITDIGAYGYAAINEPDHDGGETVGLTYSQYRDMLHGLADGVHSADPNGKVFPAGYLSGNRDREYTGHGYCKAVADLINDRTLAGFDLHTYHAKNGAKIHDTYARSHQHDADAFIAACGITRQDIDIICTETNIRGDPDAAAQGYNEETARNWFLTSMFDVWGTLRPDGMIAPGPRFPWQLWRQGNPVWYMAAQLDPRIDLWCGHTYKMLLGLLWNMYFISADPRGTGVFKLKGGGKSAWVFQNIHSSWSSLHGNTFTISGIPAGTTEVRVYDGNGLIQIVNNPGSSHQFSTPTGKSYLFVGNAE